VRSPSKQPTKGLHHPPTPPTTTVYGLYNEDPRGFLERNLKELKFIEDPRPHSPRPILSDEERELEQEQKKLSRRRTKKKRPIPYDKVQRKKKSNSIIQKKTTALRSLTAVSQPSRGWSHRGRWRLSAFTFFSFRNINNKLSLRINIGRDPYQFHQKSNLVI